MAHIRRHPGTGKWQVRYRDPTGRERSRTFARKPDALAYKAVVEADKVRGQWLDPALGRKTFGEWAELWSRTRIHLRPSTQASTDSLMRCHVLPWFGPVAVVTIQQADVQSFVSSLQATGLSRSTIRSAYLIVRGVMEVALENGALARNPCRRIKFPENRIAEIRFLTVEELHGLTTAMRDPWKPMVLLGGYCGLRFSEVVGLRARHVDILRRQIQISEAAVEVNGSIFLGPPKSQASRRTIAAPLFVAESLASHMKEHVPEPDQWLFRTSSDTPLGRSNWRIREWKPAVERAGLQPLRFHDLRHTHAALLIAQGEHPKVIQSRLGHSSIRVTLDTYGHLFDGLDELAASRLDDLQNSLFADRTRTDHVSDPAVISQI